MTLTRTIILTIIFITLACQYSLAYEYKYRESGCICTQLNNFGDRLYISYFPENTILVIDTTTMEEIDNDEIDNILKPSLFMIDSNDEYMYAISSQWPQDRLVRINLTSGLKDEITLDGEINDFTINESESDIWIIHATYPIHGESASLLEALSEQYKNSGKITRIDISGGNFNVINTANTWALPMTIWYSEYSNHVYVPHQWSYPENGDFENPDYKGSAIWIGDGYTLQKSENVFIVGGQPVLFQTPGRGCSWDENKRFYVSTSSCYGTPMSIRLIDSADNQVFMNLSFIEPETQMVLITNNCVHADNSNTIWVSSEWQNPDISIQETDYDRKMIKVDTDTYQYEIFSIDEADSKIGYFDVSSDGRTLYLPQPEDGSIIVVSPGNKEPVCVLEVITDMPYQGPSPAAIEFDASGTFDLDGDELTFHWDFDGDKIFDEPVDAAYTGDPDNPTHEYTDDYAGPVFLKVTDNYQGECETSVPVIVEIT